jgi:FixJ family two-component response regulator
VLVCDDQADVLAAMKLLLKGQGYHAVTVESPRALLHAARSDGFDLILADLNYARDTTSGEEGLDLLAGLDAQGNTTPVIVMTAWGSIDLAVEAMRRGACDFIQKPWDNDRVLAAIRKQADADRRRKSELEIAATVQQKLFPHATRGSPRSTTRGIASRRAGSAAIITIFSTWGITLSGSCSPMCLAKECRPHCLWPICRLVSAAGRSPDLSGPGRCSKP